MASQGESSEGLETGRDVGLLVGEHITAEKPVARFGELYHNPVSLSNPGDVDMSEKHIEVEAEDEDDQTDMAVGHHIIREAIKKIRDRRHEGYEDKLRVQRKIGRRKVKPIRQRVKRDKHRSEEKPDEPVEGESSQQQPPPPAPKTSQEYIAPSCTRVRMIMPGHAPPSPTLAGTAFSTSSRGLLAQLREIEMNPPRMSLPEAVDSIMESPVSTPKSSPMSESHREREAAEAWRVEAIQRRYMGLMNSQAVNLINSPADPYEMRDQCYERMSESPSP